MFVSAVIDILGAARVLFGFLSWVLLGPRCDDDHALSTIGRCFLLLHDCDTGFKLLILFEFNTFALPVHLCFQLLMLESHISLTPLLRQHETSTFKIQNPALFPPHPSLRALFAKAIFSSSSRASARRAV
jgi:hypothetical protein